MTMEAGRFIARATAAAFLFIHVGLLTLFWINGVVPMAAFNVLSVLCYAFSFILINKGDFYNFVLMAYLEILAHMTLAVFMVGWGSGFQIVLIAINLMLFFSEYIGRYLGLRTLPSVPLAVFDASLYLLCYVASENLTPPYQLPERVEFWLHIGWIITVFTISIVVLQGFVWMAFSTENVLQSRATHDRLTGLGNRQFMLEHLEELRKEHGLDGCWIAIMDIDDFKAANHTYGHNCGDYMLQTVADIMNRNKAVSEFARWGGEEFVFVGTIGRDRELHIDRLEQLRIQIADYDFYYEGVSLNVTVTIGVAEYKRGQTIEQWIDAADERLYEGKRRGKNKLVRN